MHRSVVAVLVVMLVSTVAWAEIPEVMGYQGRVTDNSGVPVADGSYTMKFRIYDAETGGTPLWDSGTHSVPVADGVFNVMLGQSPQTAITLPFDEDYWMLVTFDGEDQLPRKRLGSVGYAHMASGLVPGTEVSGLVTGGTSAAIKGTNTATSGTRYGVFGETASTAGRGLYGVATATSGTTYGVYGIGSSIGARGVFGYAPNSTGQAYGVVGQSGSSTGRGVYGLASMPAGVNYGVYGRTLSPSGYAGYFDGDARVTGDLTVDGTVTGAGVGDITAVYPGTGLDGGGVSGAVTLDVETPLTLTSSEARGVVEGINNNENTGACGVYGEATGSVLSFVNYGGLFRGPHDADIGVSGEGGLAGGEFEDLTSSSYGNVGYITYKIYGTGSVSFVQNHPHESDRVIAYAAPEGDEVATYTRGTARLVDGEARVPLGETFKWVTNPEIGLTAHLTPRGDWAELYVKSLTTETMVVASRDGTGSAVFDYIVYGLRIGFEEVTIVQEKEREAYIPSMEGHREAYAKHPDLRQYNALQRFRNMQADTYGAEPSDGGTARSLRDAIEEYDPAVHGPVSRIPVYQPQVGQDGTNLTD